MSYTPIALQHVNLVVPPGTLDEAKEFYGGVLGFPLDDDKMPSAFKGQLLWFRIGPGPQQIHVAFELEPGHPGPGTDPLSSRHPCFSLSSPQSLVELQQRIHDHRAKGTAAAAMECDAPGSSSGPKAEFPTRFFARDYAGNKLEFAVAS